MQDWGTIAKEINVDKNDVTALVADLNEKNRKLWKGKDLDLETLDPHGYLQRENKGLRPRIPMPEDDSDDSGEEVIGEEEGFSEDEEAILKPYDVVRRLRGISDEVESKRQEYWNAERIDASFAPSVVKASECRAAW